MTTGFANQPAPAIATTATTYNGFYLRNNLSSRGNLPAVSPFNLTPDIIQSSQPVDNPQVSFSTMDSWQTLYPTAPEPGQNYYYVRGGEWVQRGVFWADAAVLCLLSADHVSVLLEEQSLKHFVWIGGRQCAGPSGSYRCG